MRSDGEREDSDMPRSHRVDEPTRLFLGMVASQQSPPPLHLARSVYCGTGFQSSTRRLAVAALLSQLASFFEFAIAFRKDLSGASFEFVQRREVTNRTVKTNRIVMVHPQSHDPLRIFQ